ncbi:MAG: mechanosensitive ion channel [Pseudomonadales bacterium]|nr:mechanosensitive ion channel [Pseudomonadales bacterium]
MDIAIVKTVLSWIVPILPLLGVLLFSTITINLLLRRFHRNPDRQQNNFKHSLIVVAVVLIFVVAAILSLPINDEMRKQLLTLLGLLLTLMMAFSSTSFVANAMAGLMLRGVDNLHAGDFVRVGEQFGRVTERGLFHTEIQTQERDLTTIPNLYLVSNPVSVVRSSGTIVAAEVSLGYDNDLDLIETLLLDAAEKTGLVESFVYVKTLGDFSVVYRVAGFLEEVKQLLTVRSTLRKNMIRTLHEARVEIVSPTFMSQRVFDAQTKVIATSTNTDSQVENGKAASPEAMIFDKAESAEKKAILEQRKQLLKSKIAELQQELTIDDADVDAIEKKISVLEQRLGYVRRMMEKTDDEFND